MSPLRPRGFHARAVVAGLAMLISTGRADAQLVDDVAQAIRYFCGQVETDTASELRDREDRLAAGLRGLNRPGGDDLLSQAAADVRKAQKDVEAKQARIRAIETEIQTLRRTKGIAGPLDSQIQFQNDKLLAIQARRVGLQTGVDGQPGLDGIERRLAEIAADNFVFPRERERALAEKPGLETARARLLSVKVELAREFAFHQGELARLTAERDKQTPNGDRVKALEAELLAARRELEQLQGAANDARTYQDATRLGATAMMLGGEEIRACIAKRRAELAAREPPAKPDTPKPADRPITFSMAGTWGGNCVGWAAAVGGPFNMSAGNGAVTGTFSGQYVSGKIGGTVSSAGLVAAGGGDGAKLKVTWSGKIVDGAGKWSGSGSWSGSYDGSACNGSWTSR